MSEVFNQSVLEAINRAVQDGVSTTALEVDGTPQYCIINAETREIEIPGELNIFGVESDEKSTRVYFRCPKYVGTNVDLDMTRCMVYVPYRNANGEKDQYIVTDLNETEDGENVEFTWLISRKASAYMGITEFGIRAVKTAVGGTIEAEWNTTVASANVIRGMDVGLLEFSEENKDALAQALDLINQELEQTKNEMNSEIETKGQQTLATIPEDYTTAAQNALSAKTEVEDIRVGFDETTYESAGEAVRSQTSAIDKNLRQAVVFTTGVNVFDDNPEKVKDGYVNKNGELTENLGYFNFRLKVPFNKKAVASYTDGEIIKTANFRMAYVKDNIEKGSNDPLDNFHNDFEIDGINVVFTISSLYRNKLEINFIDIEEEDSSASGRIKFTPYTEIVKLTDEIVKNTGIVIENSDNSDVKINHLYVSPSYNKETDGYGITKFSNIISAHDSIENNSKKNRYEIIVEAGTYDFGGIWTGERSETYVGIILKDYVWIRGYNIYYPENVVIKWHGEDDFMKGTTISTVQAMKRCPIHITQNCQHGGVNGITFDCKNIRYCLHPETNGTTIEKIVEGYLQKIDIENCIFKWGGRPNCDEESNNAVACGLEPCSIIRFYRCSFFGYLGFHNNQWNYGEKPAICTGSKAIVESCLFNNNYITYSVMFSGDANTYETLEVKNCSQIAGVTIADKVESAQKLVFINEANQIIGQVVNPFTVE